MFSSSVATLLITSQLVTHTLRHMAHFILQNTKTAPTLDSVSTWLFSDSPLIYLGQSRFCLPGRPAIVSPGISESDKSQYMNLIK